RQHQPSRTSSSDHHRMVGHGHTREQYTHFATPQVLASVGVLRDDRGLEASPLRPTYLSGESWYSASSYFGGRPNLNDSLIDRITAAPRGFFRGLLSRGRDGNPARNRITCRHLCAAEVAARRDP